MTEIVLKDLPLWHPLRNRPLAGMFYYPIGSKIKSEIFPSYGISKKTYNQLGPSWTTWDTFVCVDNQE